MISSGIVSILAFILHFFAIIMALRLLMRAVYVSPHAPLAPFIISASKPFIRFVGLLVPQTGRFDLAAYLCLYGFLLAELTVKSHGAIGSHLLELMTFTFLRSLSLLINIIFFAVLIKTMMSWVSSEGHPATSQLLIPLTHWLESPIRRHVPALGALDLTPMLAILILKSVEFVLMQPLANFLLI